MELRHLRYFIAVAEERNFTRAAVRVGIGQPPLSQQIRGLEDELGTPLFRRTRQGAELTAAGAAFLPEARTVIAQAEHAKQAARRGGRGELGRLRVGFTASAAFVAAVPDAVRAFTRRYPDVALSLVERETELLLDRLREDRLDAALIRTATSADDEVDIIVLLQEPFVIAVPAGHRLVGKKSARLSALAAEPLVLFPRHAGPSLFDGLITACRSAGFEPLICQEAPQFSSAVNLVAAGLGVSLVPASMAQLRVAGVRYVPIAGAAPTVKLALATRRDEPSVLVGNFSAILRQRCLSHRRSS
ncbi:MAG: LysR family transcriptional regulator [Dokdonella sp.]